jgi:hypothetical protein
MYAEVNGTGLDKETNCLFTWDRTSHRIYPTPGRPRRTFFPLLQAPPRLPEPRIPTLHQET